MSNVQAACINCRWFFRRRGCEQGECRFKPPTVVHHGDTYFPKVKPESWCGSFEPKEPESKPSEKKSQKGLQEHERTVTIPVREHNELSYAATLLQALKDAGVEDWEGWEDAVESAQENHDGEIPHE
jgi:hypothetical protein